MSSAQSTLNADEAKLVEDEENQSSCRDHDASSGVVHEVVRAPPVVHDHGPVARGRGGPRTGLDATITQDQTTLTHDEATLDTDQQKEAADLAQAQTDCTSANTGTPAGQATCEAALETVSADEQQVSKDQTTVSKDETALGQALGASVERQARRAAPGDAVNRQLGSSPTQSGTRHPLDDCRDDRRRP